MHHVIELRLDEETEGVITSIWQEFARRGLTSRMLDAGGRPHLTLLAASRFPLEAREGELAGLAESQAPIEITFSHLGVFSGESEVLYAGVADPAPLEDLQRRLFEIFAPSVEVFPLYRPGATTFHCTLGLGIARGDLPEAAALARAVAWPMSFSANACEIVEYDERARFLASYGFAKEVV